MSPEKRVRHLLDKYLLERVEVNFGISAVYSRAIPHISNPIVELRRQEALEKLGLQASLSQVTAIVDKAQSPIALSRGSTLEECLDRLEIDLKR